MTDAVNFQLLPWQQSVMADDARFKVICAGRRCGKSRLAAVTLLIEALRCPKGSGVMYVAPTQGQARVIIWGLLLDIGRPVIASSHVNNMEITMVNGTVIYIRGADRPDTLRGVSLTYAVLDEYADMKPTAWEEVIRASLSDKRGRAMFIGTPKGRNHFYDTFHLGQDGKDPEWKSWHFTTADNPLIHPDEIAAAKRTMSTFSFKQEYMASFDNSGTDTFKEEWLKFGTAPKGEYSTYIAVDCAGFAQVSSNKKSALDRTAIAVVFVTDDGKWFVRKIEHGRWDVRETAVRILKNIRDFKPIQIGIEKGTTFNAVMPYLSDLMRKNNIFAHIQQLSHGNQNKVDRVIWALQGLFEHGRITLNRDIEWDVFIDEYLMFPTKNVHDDCFPGDAPITTERGIVPISEVTTDDMVLTRNGYRRVLKAWCKGTKKVITKYGITATPEHRIYTTERGWVELDKLVDSDILLGNSIKETSCEKPSISTDATTTGIQTQSKTTTDGITHLTQSGKTHRVCCTETYGSSTTGQYRTDTTSTMRMEMQTTTPSQILSAYPAQHIRSHTEMNAAQEQARLNNLLYSKEYEAQQKRGTHLQKVGSGTDNTHSSRSQSNTQSNPVSSAEQCINRRSIDPVCAAMLARSSEQTLCKEQELPVYDLMVETDHEFFAYGVLVHNCIDALSMISQMAVTSYGDRDDSQEYEPVDVICGF